MVRGSSVAPGGGKVTNRPSEPVPVTLAGQPGTPVTVSGDVNVTDRDARLLGRVKNLNAAGAVADLPTTLDGDGGFKVHVQNPVSSVTVTGEVEVTNDAGNPLPVTGPLTDAQLRATPVDVDDGHPDPQLDALTNAELRAAAVPVTGPLTDAQLRATPVPVSGPLTNAELRAAAVPVSGPLTDAQLRATPVPVTIPTPVPVTIPTPVPVTGPLTDLELRATPVPVVPHVGADVHASTASGTLPYTVPPGKTLRVRHAWISARNPDTAVVGSALLRANPADAILAVIVPNASSLIGALGAILKNQDGWAGTSCTFPHPIAYPAGTVIAAVGSPATILLQAGFGGSLE